MLRRRGFFLSGLSLVLLALAGAVPCLAAEELKSTEQEGVRWYDIRQLGVEGQGWTDTTSPYDRLPARAKGVVRDAVWNLSRDSAGMCVRFKSAASKIHARWTLTKANLGMPHMPATGVSGVDLYAKDPKGTWRWVACGKPAAKTTNIVLASGLAAGEHEFLLYLPLYNGVESVEVGVPADSSISDAPDYPAEAAQPIVFYGTSITHGASAMRPGMVHTALLGRWLGRPVINLGFSGNGKMELEVGQFLVELKPAVFVIDCCPNLTGPDTAARTKPLVAQLRGAHPTVPILLVEDRRYTDAWINPSKAQKNDENHAALKKSFDELIAAGDKNLYYLTGDQLLGDDTEGAVDSSHPTDLGFYRQAVEFEKALRPILK
ncbi:hypothetical protein Pan44_26040 [Caulifigura coniformis]|uniref:SGNH hydrolase-type esterase domain-containing protein n=1 Tax=Caulifigura coniformis TaxID=2527983 RepID=A0A517SEN1_9PLAN|nr:SGNH/GDSL hydrolase family protein [Caulifigura coniformis]QDT54571.1 hypothetical protein Pan44_26040 [Caulifigura coniformis]